MNRLIASCFGLGRLPVCPGTWGSLPPAIIFALLCRFGAPAGSVSTTMAVFAVAGAVLCVKFAPAAIAATGKSDPPEVVVDEIAGQAVTFLMVPLVIGQAFTTGQIWAVAAAGFVLFRIFDIAKPWPIRKLEKFPQGWGVLADDLLAGVYAAITLLICTKLWLA